MLKIALLDCAINEKFCGVDGGWRKAKKVLMPGGQPERELTAALTVNETISNLDHIALSVPNQLVFTF